MSLPRSLTSSPLSAQARRHVCRSSTLAAALLLAATCLRAVPAFAQDECEPQGARGPIEVMPSAGASGVRLDDPLRITFTRDYFASTAAPLPSESFLLLDADDQPVPGEVQLASDDVLFFLPTGGFQPDMLYTGVAFGDVDLPFSFRTGNAPDARPPSVSPLSFLGSSRVDPMCLAPEGGYRVDLTFSVSLDDGAPGSIEYHLYLARADGLDAPLRVARLRNFTADRDVRVPISFVLEEGYARRAICVQLMVTDGVGNIAEGSPFCFDPVEGANFAGLCSVGPQRGSAAAPDAGARSWWLGWLALGLVVARIGRRAGHLARLRPSSADSRERGTAAEREKS